MTELLVGFGGILAGCGGLLGGLAAYRQSRRTHEEVRTNHGKRAGEYLEMIPELASSVASVQVLLAQHVNDERRHN